MQDQQRPTYSEIRAACTGPEPEPHSDGQRPVVCVQGLGFVGRAMSLAVADARNDRGEAVFNVIGLDLPGPGDAVVAALNGGRLPGQVSDPALLAAAARAANEGNLVATTDPRAISAADIIVIDINLDLDDSGPSGSEPSVSFDGLKAAVSAVGENMMPGALVIVEVTVPPGTCAQVVAPTLEAALMARGLPRDSYLLAHSYERVMPGADYFSSIVNFWRVYSGHTADAADACEAFLSRIINTGNYPLTRLTSTTASETAKLMENSYRAANIAFIEEWSRFADASGIDLFEVIDAIRVRPTHNNIRFPGLGVGGYCLTKDPLFARAGAIQLLDRPDIKFPFCELAVETNQRMPLSSVNLLKMALGGLDGKRVLLLGVSYRPEVDDTRSSPSESFLRALEAEGATVVAHDPYVTYWNELERNIDPELPAPSDFDAIVFAVAHGRYVSLDLLDWLDGAPRIIVDANGVLPRDRRLALEAAGHGVFAIGVGRTTGKESLA